jgi:hypothetical protein
MMGDGYSSVMHCENAEDHEHMYIEPDGGPIYCHFMDEPAELDFKAIWKDTFAAVFGNKP